MDELSLCRKETESDELIENNFVFFNEELKRLNAPLAPCHMTRLLLLPSAGDITE